MKILWNIGESDEQAVDSGGAVPGDPHLEAGQVPVGWYLVEDTYISTYNFSFQYF